jgi:hypothetical protein
MMPGMIGGRIVNGDDSPQVEERPGKNGLGAALRFILDITGDIFIAALVLFSILVVLEALNPGFVSFFFNLDILVPIILVAGAIAIFTRRSKGDSSGSGG